MPFAGGLLCVGVELVERRGVLVVRKLLLETANATPRGIETHTPRRQLDLVRLDGRLRSLTHQSPPC